VNLTELSVKKPLFAWMVMTATVVFGSLAASRIGISQYPDVDFPTISVMLLWQGAAPDVMEQEVVELVEEAVMQVEGVRAISSSSRQGAATITIELDLSRDVDIAMQDVQAKVSGLAHHLPQDMDPPTVAKTNPEDQPIIWLAVSGPYSRQLLADIAKYRVREKLQTIPGVGEVAIGGSLERNVRIWVDASKLDARGVTVTEVIAALAQQHIELPAGRIETDSREVSVRVLGEAFDIATLAHIVVRETGAGPVYLSDVALVEDGFEDIRRLTRADGVPAQGLGIRKQRGANAVAVGDAVLAAIADMQKTLPAGMTIGVNFDATRFIRDSVHEVELELLLSVLLTALVCWLFLGSFSNTLNVALAIPMSLLGTIAAIYFLGFTLNTFTLLALALAVGIVVDDAIMVLENIFRHAEAGKDKVTAAREGTAQITFAALTATLAIIAIFIPVIFMEGVIGRFFLQFGITFSIAVLLSYLEAVTLAPARSSQMLSTEREGRSRIGRLVDEGFTRLAAAYQRGLTRTLARPWTVLLLASLLFVGALVLLTRMPSEFVPSQDQSRLQLRVQTAVGSSLDETNGLVRKIEASVAALPEVEHVFTTIGGGWGAVNAANLSITLVEPRARQKSQAEVAIALRKELNTRPGVRVVVQDPSQQGFTAQRGFPVEFSVRGPDWEQLVRQSREMMRKLTESGLVVDLDTDYQVGMPELRILPDRARAADLGVPVERIATTINALVGGVRAGRYSSGGRRVDVRLRLLAAQRQRPEDVAGLRVRSDRGNLVPLSAVVTTEERPALLSITRRERERAITVFANVAPGKAQSDALAKVEELGRELPPGYHAVLGGASVAFRQSMSGLVFALLLGVVVAYMLLTSQFNSLIHPLTVLTILPLSVAGAAAALWATGRTLNVFSMIGLLLLMGIVKKNSILLVDYANQQRELGRDAATAMSEAGPVRLRPILMTSVATMMAAVPAALGLGAGSEMRMPMAIAVIGGLVVSTALSLFVVPAFYVVSDRGVARLRRALQHRATRVPATHEQR
jgi:hydrophobe/amphiphile efflux-1 (HAE1) family protein